MVETRVACNPWLTLTSYCTLFLVLTGWCNHKNSSWRTSALPQNHLSATYREQNMYLIRTCKTNRAQLKTHIVAICTHHYFSLALQAIQALCRPFISSLEFGLDIMKYTAEMPTLKTVTSETTNNVKTLCGCKVLFLLASSYYIEFWTRSTVKFAFEAATTLEHPEQKRKVHHYKIASLADRTHHMTVKPFSPCLSRAPDALTLCQMEYFDFQAYEFRKPWQVYILHIFLHWKH